MSYLSFIQEARYVQAQLSGRFSRDVAYGNPVSADRKKDLTRMTFYMSILESVSVDTANAVLSADDLEFMVRDINSTFGTSLSYNFS